MSTHTIDEQLTKYLTDVHSIEVQALAQMKAAPRIAGDDRLAAIFTVHIDETADQERRVREALAQRGADTSTLKDIAGRVGGWAMVAFAKLNPDTPGKLVAHAFSYEHMEIAAYELLARTARRAGDERVAEMARAIADEERVMAQRIATAFDIAVDAALREKATEDIEEELVSYLTDAHAIESQAVKILESGPHVADVPPLTDVFREHLAETRVHRALIEQRLAAHVARPSRFQSTTMKIGGLNIGAFFGAQPDTPIKLAGFAYAFEHLEIASYELLRRVATRAGDPDTVDVAERILREERRAATLLTQTWDPVLDATLGALVGGATHRG